MSAIDAFQTNYELEDIEEIDYEDTDIYSWSYNYECVSNTNTKRRPSKSTTEGGKTCTT